MIIDKCTKPDREDRFNNCREIVAALRKYPKVVRKNYFLSKAKYGLVAAILAFIISFAITNYETVVSYAAYDAQLRVPAVKERLGLAGVRIRQMLSERYGEDVIRFDKPAEEEE